MRATAGNCIALAAMILLSIQVKGQDSISTPELPNKYFDHVSSKFNHLNQKVHQKSRKALDELKKQEQKLRNKLEALDSLAAQNVFRDVEQKYQQLEERLNHANKLTQYIPYFDTLKTSFKFLEQNQEWLGSAKEIQQKFKEALNKIEGLESDFEKAELIRKFLRERKQFLKDELSKFGFAKELKKLNKQVYYYSQQINEYKEILKDPKKIERKAIELLTRTKVFQDFMRKHSMLASLFRLPGGDPNDPSYQASLAGLQTRSQVNQLIQQQIASGGPNAMSQVRQNLQAGQAQLNELKNRINQFGGGSSDLDPDSYREPDFKPNTQKTKSFFKRLEYGVNLQSQKATTFFPVTSDIALSLGYKLNDKSIIGIGASYKIGWGRGWNDIEITHQGIGLRSYADIKLKGSFWISVGYEQNYRAEFRNVDQLRDYSAWQKSGLIGISKVVSLKTKLFKKTRIQLLWDYLSYKQVPRTTPVIFRIGYNF